MRMTVDRPFDRPAGAYSYLWCNDDVLNGHYLETLFVVSLPSLCSVCSEMVKLFAITVLYKGDKAVQKKAAYELSSFGFFQRSGYKI